MLMLYLDMICINNSIPVHSWGHSIHLIPGTIPVEFEFHPTFHQNHFINLAGNSAKFLVFHLSPGLFHCLPRHFSHPFLGTYEVVQFLELGNLKGTHPRVVYELHTNPMVSWDANPIPYPIPSHLISYHSTSYHTIPFHVIPYHHLKPVTGCLGSFLQNIKKSSAGCNTDPLGSIFCGLVV